MFPGCFVKRTLLTLIIVLFTILSGAASAQKADGEAQVTAVEHLSTGDRIRVVVHFDRPVRFLEGTAVDPDRIFFDLQDTRPAGALVARTAVGEAPLRRIRVSQYQPGITRVVLDVDSPAPYLAAFLPDPPRLVVEIPRTAVAAQPRAVIAPAPMPSAPAPALVAPLPAGSVTPSDSRLSSRIGDAGSGDPNTLLQAAQRGNANAAFQLGDLFMTGRGVTRDPAAAATWYRAAAQQGHAVAAGNLGVLYANGWGVPQSDTEAVIWFQKAAEAGDSGGENNLGSMYLSGRGVEQSDVLGAKWLLSAARLGVPEAQYALGTLYANGRGVPRDEAQAMKWMKASAAQGYIPAQLALGKMYVADAGGGRDYAEALRIFRSLDTPGAWYQIGLMYQQGLGVTASEAEAAVWWLKAAQSGSTEAQAAIGRLYLDRDPAQAYSWFALAAANGDKESAEAMNELEPRLTPEQLSEAKQRALAWAKPQQ